MKPFFARFFLALVGMCATGFVLGETVSPMVTPHLDPGQLRFSQTCVACHSSDGNATMSAYPKLAGQHAAYLVKQLSEFKSGKRANAVMAGFAGALSPLDMQHIAAWLASQKMTPGAAKNKATVAWGEKIYRGGIASKNVPACAGCHSPNGAGIPVQYPRLGGQNFDYTVAQLKAFRDGVRTNGPSMLTIAAKLSDKEIEAVADYISGLR
jgi:cytochrome c553